MANCESDYHISHIDFSEILYIAHGHWTPAFESRKDSLDPKFCFSVVSKDKILDIQAQSQQIAQFWVTGLRRLIGQTDDIALKLSKKGLNDAFIAEKLNEERKRLRKEHMKKTKGLKLLEQDLFVQTLTAVFRNLEQQQIYDIDQSIRDKFEAKSFYELALRENIPWKQWNIWIKTIITSYLKENDRMIVSKLQN